MLLKPKLTVNTSCDGGPADKTEELPSFGLQDSSSFHPHSHWTSGPPTDPTRHDHTRPGSSKSIEKSRYEIMRLSVAPHVPQQDHSYPVYDIDPQHIHLPSPNARRDTLADLSNEAAARVNFDHRYLHDKAVWNSPPKRLYSVSISPGRRDSDNSGLTNISASASYRSGTTDAQTSSLEPANIEAHDGVLISNDKGDLPAGLRPDMDGNWRTGRSGTRAAAYSSSAVVGPGLREETNQSTSDNKSGFVPKRRGVKAKKESAGKNKTPHLDPLGKTAAVDAENLAPRVETDSRWGNHGHSTTTTPIQSNRDAHESGSAIHCAAVQSFADSSNHRQDHTAGDLRNAIPKAETQDQSLHILDYKQRLRANSDASRDYTTMCPGNLATSGSQLQSVLPYTMMGPVPVNIGGSGGQQQSAAPHGTPGPANVDVRGGQQQSAAPHSVMGSANIGASDAHLQPIPPYPTVDPTRHPAILPKNVLAMKLINGQKYSMRPGFKGSTTLWPFDGVTEDQLYLCSVGEDGSVNLTPSSSALPAPVQPFTALSSGQPAPRNSPAAQGNPQHSLPDFGPIGPPNQGHSYGAAPGWQLQNTGLSRPSTSRIEANQEGPSQMSNTPPSWGLPRSPIRAQEWNLPVPQAPQAQLQQGPFTYSSPSTLKPLIVAQLEKSHHGHAESRTTQIWNSSQQQYAGPQKDSEKSKENLRFTPTATGPLLPSQHHLSITEISNVSPRALVPRSGTAWTTSAASPNIADPFLSGVFNNSWESPAGKGMSPVTFSPALPLAPYRQFLDMTFPQAQGGYHGIFGQQVLHNGKPSYEVAISPEFLPFFEATKSMKPAEWGVIKIGSVSICPPRRKDMFSG